MYLYKLQCVLKVNEWLLKDHVDIAVDMKVPLLIWVGLQQKKRHWKSIISKDALAMKRYPHLSLQLNGRSPIYNYHTWYMFGCVLFSNSPNSFSFIFWELGGFSTQNPPLQPSKTPPQSSSAMIVEARSNSLAVSAVCAHANLEDWNLPLFLKKYGGQYTLDLFSILRTPNMEVDGRWSSFCNWVIFEKPCQFSRVYPTVKPPKGRLNKHLR